MLNQKNKIFTGIVIGFFLVGSLFASENNKLKPLTSKKKLLEKVWEVMPQTTITNNYFSPELELKMDYGFIQGEEVKGEVFIRGDRAFYVFNYDNLWGPRLFGVYAYTLTSYDGSSRSQNRLFNSKERLGSNLGFNVYVVESTDLSRLISHSFQQIQKNKNKSLIKK